MKKPSAPKPVLLIVMIGVALVLSIVSCLLVWNHQSKPDGIVYVDAIRLMNGYEGMKEARKQYDLKVGGWNANLDSLKAELELQFKDYESRRTKLSTNERQSLEVALETQRTQYLEYQKVISDKIAKADQEATTGVYAKVNEYIKKYAEEKGYRFVLGANQYGGIVYADKQNADITDDVLVGLNKVYTK